MRWNSSCSASISASRSASSLLARRSFEFNSAFRMRSCSIIVSKLLIFDLMFARSFSIAMIWFLSSSILSFSSSICDCTSNNRPFASFRSFSSPATFSSSTALSSRILARSASLPAICSCITWIRSRKCLSFPCAPLICSLNTLISPSSFPRMTLASVSAFRVDSISRSSSSICTWISSYSTFIRSYCCAVLL